MSTYLAGNLKVIRKSYGLSQEKFAGMIGVSRTAYQAYEDGRNKPTIEVFKALHKLFGIPIEVIMNEEITTIHIFKGTNKPKTKPRTIVNTATGGLYDITSEDNGTYTILKKTITKKYQDGSDQDYQSDSLNQSELNSSDSTGSLDPNPFSVDKLKNDSFLNSPRMAQLEMLVQSYHTANEKLKNDYIELTKKYTQLTERLSSKSNESLVNDELNNEILHYLQRWLIELYEQKSVSDVAKGITIEFFQMVVSGVMKFIEERKRGEVDSGKID